MDTVTTQVAVVGAGPVGLFAALCAANRGLDVCVLDQNWRGYAPGFAALLHASSLRLLDDLDLVGPLKDAGRSLRNVAVHIAGTRVAELELEEPVLAIPQRTLEETLLTALRRRGVELRAPFQATTIENGGSRIHLRVLRRELVTLGSPAHYSEWEPVEASMVDADYLVGADGYESRVRTALGIKVLEVGSVQSYAMFELASDEDESTIDLGFAGDLGSAMIPLPGNRVRWGFQIHSALNDTPDGDYLRRMIRERAPWRDGPVGEIDWATVTHFERRLARPFGRKQVWLAGDAAHVTGPFGGQSMNVGLSEAHGLIQHIADVIEGKRGPEVLEKYDAERQREWHKLLGCNVHFDLLPHAPRWLGLVARQLVPALPASGRDLERLLAKLGLAVR